MIIVITQPFFFDGEAERIVLLLRHGKADLVHIRKPQASREETEELIRKIPSEWHGRLVLHDHHKLALKYGLHGIHLNRRNPEPLKDWLGAVSISCHSLEELEDCLKRPYAYMSLSPVFDSISKQGYLSAFTGEQIAEAHKRGIINERVMALGGVTFARVDDVMEMGFGGAMILGDAWK